MTAAAHPTTPPRPVFETLPAAVSAALKWDNKYTDIKPHKWAETYACSEEDVKREWERQVSLLSQHPNNPFEENE